MNMKIKIIGIVIFLIALFSVVLGVYIVYADQERCEYTYLVTRDTVLKKAPGDTQETVMVIKKNSVCQVEVKTGAPNEFGDICQTPNPRKFKDSKNKVWAHCWSIEKPKTGEVIPGSDGYIQLTYLQYME